MSNGNYLTLEIEVKPFDLSMLVSMAESFVKDGVLDKAGLLSNLKENGITAFRASLTQKA